MAEVKRCVQCGLLKEEEAFRKYTYSRENNTEGRYRVCKTCEAINTAYRRARQWMTDRHLEGDATAVVVVAGETETYRRLDAVIKKTEKLYAVLESRGLRVPQAVATKQDGEVDCLDSLLAFYKEETGKSTVAVISADTPDELLHWLNVDKQEWKDNCLSPEYLQETIYESLKAKYRPQTGVNKETFIPVYDDTYKAVLNQILRRFDDYEEECSLDDSNQD